MRLSIRKSIACEIERDAPLTPFERVCAGLALLSPHLAILAIALICGGCVYKGAKVTEGTDIAIGLNVPVSEGTLQIQALNYLSGFRLGVDRNAILTCRYTVCESNSYFGCVHTHVTKTMDATVEPCIEAPTNAPSFVASVPSDAISTNATCEAVQ